MVWRPQITGLQSRQYQYDDGGIDSSAMTGGGNKHLFVETHLMTPEQSSVVYHQPRMLSSELPPLSYAGRPPLGSKNNGKLTAKPREQVEKILPRKQQQHQVQQQKEQQQQHLQQQHFFTTPRTAPSSGIPTRIIGVEGGGGSVCGDSVITTNTTLPSVDSRNDEASSMKRSVFLTGKRDTHAKHDENGRVDTFSEKVRGEMRRVQAALGGGGGGGSSVTSVSSRTTTSATLTSWEKKKQKEQTAYNDGNDREIVNEQYNRETFGRKNERLDYREQALVNERRNERRENHELSELKQQLRTMEIAADSEISELKHQLRTLGEAADSEITDLKHQLRTIQREADSQVFELKQELRLAKQAAEAEILDLKQYIRITDDGYASKSTAMAETYARQLDDMERTYKDAFAGSVAENDQLREEIHTIQEEAENKLHLMEKECNTVKKRCDLAEHDCELRQLAIKEVESKYEDLIMEKERLERMESKRLAMLDEMTIALEVAIAEKDDVILRYNDLRDETVNYSNLVNDNIQFGRENLELRNELDNMVKECEVLRSRLDLMDEMTETLEVTVAEKEDATLRCSSLLGEQKVLKSTTESVAHALERALAEKNEAIDRYNELEREHADLRNATDSASQITDMMTQQMIDKYHDEIDELKRKNVEILRQRDELKEELICVLETASSLQR
jgi:hypothetical protein